MIQQMMKIIDKTNNKEIGEYWFANPFTGIGGFPTETKYPENMEIVEGAEPPAPIIIEKECISRFLNNKWRRAFLNYELPPTTDEQDDKKYDEILSSYKTALIETPKEEVEINNEPSVPKEGEVILPKLTSIEITPVTKNDAVKETPFDISIKYIDDKGADYVKVVEPTIESVYNLCNIEGVTVTPFKKGVDIIRVTNEGVVKDLVIKIRDNKPYPDIVEECGVKWVLLQPNEVMQYIASGIIKNPELETLILEREYYTNELFEETKAWADPAIRAVASQEQLASVDSYRQSVAEMLNYLNAEIAKLSAPPASRRSKRSISMMVIPERKRPIIANKPEFIYEYKLTIL